jgi:hypothetical protein
MLKSGLSESVTRVFSVNSKKSLAGLFKHFYVLDGLRICLVLHQQENLHELLGRTFTASHRL